MPPKAQNNKSGGTRSGRRGANNSTDSHGSLSIPKTRSASRESNSTLNQVRQLRSRTIVVPSTTNASTRDQSNLSAECSVRGRRRSQSTNSNRVSEENVCSAGNTRRTSARSDAKARIAVTRSSTRSSRSRSARMTLPNSSINLRRLAGGERSSPRSLAVVSTFSAQTQKTDPKSKLVPPLQDESEMSLQISTPKDQIGCQCVSLGCEVRTPSGNGDGHMLQCDLRSFPCPLSSEKCRWNGILRDALNHILRGHSSVSHGTGPNAQLIVQNWKHASPIEWITLQTCLGRNFLIVVQKINKSDKFSQFYGTVKIFGRQEDADRFEFRMTLKTSGSTDRAFSYSTVVRALHEGSSTISEGDCFIFDTSHATLFSHEETLVLDVSISVMKM